MTRNISVAVLSFFLVIFFSTTNAQVNTMHPKNEFRAVWIATVVNIDWPKTSIDGVEKEKADFIEILDTYKKLNYNAVIVQIRSVGDAFYPSKFAPWSRYLTGKEGKAPDPYYDPLEWMINETHARGFEFHAWFNPFRATFDLKKETLSPNHDMIKHPEWMIKYGEKYYYNPGLPEVQNHLVAVVDEVVKNYDIDAVHFDDYFYPYKIAGQDFNDVDAYTKYGNGLSLADWRRLNVNNYVKCTNYAIKKLKPWVQFGISPFGVWRNKSVDPRGSDTQSGQTNYDDLFADPMAWMEFGWIDY
ncbi:glycoside hydrolase family 10 protein, partial [Flavobacterium sp.]|uniref:glycoside hydrolase family 10 protein n=1 Tax=Flavobacterium sp. TaxID=239 RepID=UPI003C376DA2